MANCERIPLRLTAITFSLVILACAVFATVAHMQPARAQVVIAHRPAAPAVVPGFWDPRRRPERPDLARLTAIRFMTEVDYPPFNFAGPDGNPAGFNVELARMVCEELKVTCTVQMRRFDTLFDSLDANRGDAIAASPRLASSESNSVSKRRIWTVQVTFNSSQTIRASSTLNPAGLPSGPAKLNGG